MLEICGEDVVQLPTVHSTVLEKVLAWCEHHKDDRVLTKTEEAFEDRVYCDGKLSWNDEKLKRRENIASWDVAFMGTDLDVICDLMKAANYLDIPGLLKVGCKTLATRMTDQNPVQLRADLGIVNNVDLTEESNMFEDYASLI